MRDITMSANRKLLDLYVAVAAQLGLIPEGASA
jgi:hypothetical protein